MAGPRTGGKTMKLIRNHELQKRTESELSALFCTVSKGLVRTKRGSPERRNALASLENIGRARVARLFQLFGIGGGAAFRVGIAGGSGFAGGGALERRLQIAFG